MSDPLADRIADARQHGDRYVRILDDDGIDDSCTSVNWDDPEPARNVFAEVLTRDSPARSPGKPPNTAPIKVDHLGVLGRVDPRWAYSRWVDLGEGS